MRKFILSIMIYLISFQLCFAETIQRMPSSDNAHELSIEELNQKLSEFKTKIAGREEASECPSPLLATPVSNSDQRTVHLMDRLTTNACSLNSFTYEQEAQSGDQSCTPVRTPGLIDRMVESTMMAEQNEEEPEMFRLDNPEIRELHKEAEFLYSEVRKYLYTNQTDRAVKQQLLIDYIDSVLMRMRDLVVVKRGYLSDLEYDGRFFYETLLPEFPSTLIRDNDTISNGGISTSVIDQITMGPNPSVDPFQLEIIEKGFGRLTVGFRPLDIMSRDILTLMKAPTSHNYLRALKWMTLQMMLSQLQIYKSIAGDTTPTVMPRSCQAHRNSELPSEIQLMINPETGAEYVETMMMSHGLLFDQSDYQAVEYFVENIDRNPSLDGYSGLLGFEKYQSAKAGLSGQHRGSNRAAFDDVDHFESVFQLKLPQAMQVFKGTLQPPRTRDPRARTAPRRINYAGIEEFNQIVSMPAEYQIYTVETATGRSYTLDPQRQNLSTYMAEAMVRAGKLNFEDLISPALKDSLTRREIKHELPPLHGPHVWRMWGLQLLSQELHDQLENQEVRRMVSSLCQIMPTSSREKFCGRDPNKSFETLVDGLREFRVADEYIPLRRLEEKQIEEIYPLLGQLWILLRDQVGTLAEARTNEYDFLLDQMQAYNPWARMRLSYLIHRDELTQARNQHVPVVVVGQRNRTTQGEETRCLYTQIDSRLQKLDLAAESLGLNRPLSILHGDESLNRREKTMLWTQTVDSINEGNSSLFTEQINGQQAYDYLDKITYKTFLDRSTVEEFISSEMPALDSQTRQELEEVLTNEQNGLRQALFDLYKTKGQPEQQLEAFQTIVRDFGIQDSLRTKVSFLLLDSEIKKPLMKNIIRFSAEQRKNKIEESLEDFCELQPDDFDSYKTLFYATSKSQNKLNELAGLPAVPEQILEKINEMSPEEWTNLWLGLGAGVLGIGAVLVGGACAAVTGGLCAPLSAAMIGAGASAISMQMALIGREYQMKINADRMEAQVQALEEMGFASSESAYQVSRTWFWTAFEAIFVIPLIGVSARAVKVGSKLFYVSTSHTMNGTSRQAFREAAKTTLNEADVRMARYKLGMDHLNNPMTVQSLARAGAAGAEASTEIGALLIRQGVPEQVVREAFEDIDKLRLLFASGQLSMDAMMKQMTRILGPLQQSLRGSSSLLQRQFGSVVVNESKNLIDQRTAEVVASYFGQNPNGLLNLIKSYTGRRLVTAEARMAKVQAQTGFTQQLPLVRNLVNWFRKIRSEELVKNGDQLKALEAQLEAVVRSGGDLQQFITRNIETLNDVFLNMPLRKRELPYFMMVLGGPSMGGRLAGSKIPVLGTLTDGFMLRQLFNARSRLVYESFKREAREVLRLPHHVAAESGYTVYKGFQFSTSEAIASMAPAEARVFMNQVGDLEAKIGQRLYQHLVSLGADGKSFRFTDGRLVHNLDQGAIQRLLFQPQNLEEKALGEAIWASMPHERLFAIEELSDVAHKAVGQLSQYETADQFQSFLNAMKVLVIQKDPAVVQFF